MPVGDNVLATACDSDPLWFDEVFHHGRAIRSRARCWTQLHTTIVPVSDHIVSRRIDRNSNWKCKFGGPRSCCSCSCNGGADSAGCVAELDAVIAAIADHVVSVGVERKSYGIKQISRSRAWGSCYSRDCAAVEATSTWAQHHPMVLGVHDTIVSIGCNDHAGRAAQFVVTGTCRPCPRNSGTIRSWTYCRTQLHPVVALFRNQIVTLHNTEEKAPQQDHLQKRRR